MSSRAFPSSSADRIRHLALPRGRSLELGTRPLVLGVVNVTPDSFSDGGRFLDPRQAIEHGLSLVAEGADLLDLGAESTRPGGGVYGAGASEVAAGEEIDRLLPVIAGLRRETDVPLSVDTRKGAVAAAALAAGADLINDVSALADPALGAAVAQAGCPLILMHSRGSLATMQQSPHYDDLEGEIRGELGAAMEYAIALGIDRGQLLVDPGIGFGKSYQHNLAILARLGFLDALGLPLVVGASRKSFIGYLSRDAPPQDRLAGSLATVAWAAAAGAAMVRVHDVRDTVRFLAVWQAIAAQCQPALETVPR